MKFSLNFHFTLQKYFSRLSTKLFWLQKIFASQKTLHVYLSPNCLHIEHNKEKTWTKRAKNQLTAVVSGRKVTGGMGEIILDMVGYVQNLTCSEWLVLWGVAEEPVRVCVALPAFSLQLRLSDTSDSEHPRADWDTAQPVCAQYIAVCTLWGASKGTHPTKEPSNSKETALWQLTTPCIY